MRILGGAKAKIMKKVERGTAFLPAGGTAANNVNLTKTFDMTQPHYVRVRSCGASVEPSSSYVTGKLNSNTQLSLDRQVGTYATAVEWEVVQLAGVKNWQKYTVTVTSGTQLINITPLVNADAAIVISSHRAPGSGGTCYAPHDSVSVASPSQLIHRGHSAGTLEIYVFELE